jgi:hypothetical protein
MSSLMGTPARVSITSSHESALAEPTGSVDEAWGLIASHTR